ncbi:MAG: LCP family protein [Clostridia bacterium]|nr:LCP family protein [Clostridia bacterium]
MSNENKNTLEEYIAPAKTAEEIRAERAAAAAAKARAEAEEAARLEAEKLAKIQAEEAAKRAEEERLAREQSVRDALKHFGEEVDHDAVQARRQARIQERRRIEAELQAEAQANAISPRERKKLEKKAAKGDEVARAQILAADAVQKKARERLAEFDRLNGTSPYDTRPFATVTDGMTFEEPKKKKKVWRKVLAAILALLIIAGTVLGVFIYRKLNMIGSNVDEYTGVEEILENDIDAAAIDSITDANSLTALMKAWYLNGGEPMQSKNVTNILLIGIDSDSKLSDSMMVLSVNRLAKTLSLVSFYRDSYTYMETATGANAFAKMNAAYYYGGAEMVQDVIEKDYKIKIDDYALVGYDSFPKLVDALGGVDVKVSKKEAEYLNRTWKKWTRTGKKIQFKAGTMHMDGEHALMFARIRKLDSDINRTERQRRVITAIMAKFKTASVKQVNAAINAILPEIKTSMRKSQMLDLASDAVTQGWLKYPLTQAVMPPVEYCKEGYAGEQWIWICDYEGAAFELQNMLYGQSNITLAEDRKNALDFSNGKTMTTTRGAGSGNRTYTTRPAYTGNRNTTAYQTTQGTTQGGGAWWQTTTQSGGGEGTTAGGGANPWWWRQSTTQAQPQPQPQPTTAAPAPVIGQ